MWALSFTVRFLRYLLIAVGVIAALYLIHLVLTYAEGRGWVYYRSRPPRMRFLGMLEELADPRVEYLIEEQTSEAIRADQAESGEEE